MIFISEGESVYSHTLSKKEEMDVKEDEEAEAEEEETEKEEEEDGTAWILDTLGVDNTSQAAAKLSSITILCILISVTIVLVLDANFVARIKRAEAASSIEEDSADHMGESNAASKDEDGGDCTMDAARQDTRQRAVDGPSDSIPSTAPVTNRGLGSIFGKHTYTHLSPSHAREKKESFSSRWHANDDNVSETSHRLECEIGNNMSQSLPKFGGTCKELFSV